MARTNSAVVELLVRIKDEASKALGKITKDLDGFQRKVKDVSRNLMKAGAVMGAASFFPIKKAADFEQSMSKVAAIMFGTKAGSDEVKGSFEALTAVARKMGETTKYTATESAEALTYLAMAGLDSEQSIKALPGVLALAAAGNLDLATAADLATNVLSGLALPVEDLGRVNDNLAFAASRSNTNVQELAEALKIAGPAATATGTEMESIVAILGGLANNGIKASSAGNQVKRMLVALTAPTPKATAALGQLGIATTDAEGKFRGLAPILNDLGKSLDGMTDKSQGLALMKDVFGLYAATAAAAASRAGKDIEKLEAGMRKAADGTREADGAAKAMADTMLNNLKGSFTIFMSAVEGLILTIALPLMGVLKKIVDGGTAVISMLTNMMKALGPVGPILLGIVGVGGVLLAFLGALGFAINLGITSFRGLSTAAAYVNTQLTLMGTRGAVSAAGLNATSAAAGKATVAMAALGRALAIVSGVLGSFALGWSLGPIVGEWEIGATKIKDWVGVIIALVDRFITTTSLLFLKGKRAMQDFFGQDTAETEAAIQEKERYLDFIDGFITERLNQEKSLTEGQGKANEDRAAATAAATASIMSSEEDMMEYMRIMQEEGVEAAEAFLQQRVDAAKAAGDQEVTNEKDTQIRKKALQDQFIREYGSHAQAETLKLQEEYDKQLKALQELSKNRIALAEQGSEEYFRLQVQQKMAESELEKKHQAGLFEIQQNGAKNRLNIEKLALAEKAAAIDMAVFQGVQTQEEANIELAQNEADFTKKVLAERVAALEKSSEFYSQDSEEYQAVLQEKVDAERAYTAAVSRLRDEQNAAITQKMGSDIQALEKTLAEKTALIQQNLAAETITDAEAKEQKLAAEKAFWEQVVAIRHAALRETEALYGRDHAAYQSALQASVQAEQSLASTTTELKTSLKEGAEEAEDTAESIDTVTEATDKAASSTKAFAQGFYGIWNGISDHAYQISKKVGDALNGALTPDTDAATARLDEYKNKLQAARDEVQRLSKAQIMAMPFSRVLLEQSQRSHELQIQYYSGMVEVEQLIANAGSEAIRTQGQVNALLRTANSLKASNNLLSQEELEPLYAAIDAAKQRVYEEEKLQAVRNSDASTEALEKKIAEAQKAGLDISNYGFDKQGQANKEALEDEMRLLDERLAKERLAHLEKMQNLSGEEREAQEAAYRLVEEEIRNQQDLLRAKLDVQMIELDNRKAILEIENDLKIKAWEEEMAREKERHELVMKHIEAENGARDKYGVGTPPQQFSTGGPVLKFARGGKLPGESTQDSLWVKARPGEWFIRNEAARHWTQQFGGGFMAAINNPWSAAGEAIRNSVRGLKSRVSATLPAPKQAFATGGMVQAFSNGGAVQPPGSGKTTRIEFVAPSGKKATGVFENDVNQILEVILEAGGRTV